MNLTIQRSGNYPGIYYTYIHVFYSDYSYFPVKCGSVPTSSPLEIKTYGGNQQFFSMAFVHNLIQLE